MGRVWAKDIITDIVAGARLGIGEWRSLVAPLQALAHFKVSGHTKPKICKCFGQEAYFGHFAATFAKHNEQ